MISIFKKAAKESGTPCFALLRITISSASLAQVASRCPWHRLQCAADLIMMVKWNENFQKLLRSSAQVMDVPMVVQNWRWSTDYSPKPHIFGRNLSGGGPNSITLSAEHLLWLAGTMVLKPLFSASNGCPDSSPELVLEHRLLSQIGHPTS